MSQALESCQYHQKAGIAVECQIRDENNYSILCENCLAEKANNKHIFLLKDAKLVFEQFRLEFQNQYEEEQKEKIGFLKNMQMIVQKLQNHFSSTFDQINNKINERIELSTLIFDQGGMQNDQFENFCGTLNIRNFGEQLIEELSKCQRMRKIGEEQSVIEFQNQIQHQILSLQQDDILNECLELIIQVDVRKKIKLIDNNEMNEENKKLNVQRTPKLDLICKQHDKEIILFDLSEQQERDYRARCVECDPCIFTSLSKCQNMWRNYERQQSEILTQFYQSRTSQIGIIKQLLFQLKSSFIEKINAIIIQLNGIMAQTDLEVFKILSSIGKDWDTMTLNEILDIADILSKPEQMRQTLKDMEIKYKLKNLNIDCIFQDSIEELQEINNQIALLNLCFINEQEYCQSPKNNFRLRQNSGRMKRSTNSTLSDNSQAQQKEQIQDLKIKKPNKFKSLEEWRIQQLKWSDKYIDYQLFFTKKQAEWCNALAFNKQGNIMIAGCIYSIKIFDFLRGRIVQTYQAKQHSGDINSLLFSKKINQFFSGSDDRTIRVWSQIDQKDWKCVQVLQGHLDWVLCLIQTEDEQILLSGSRDRTIKKWFKNEISQAFECTQTLTIHSDAVLGLSLNKSESFLVSCSYDKSIIIWEIKESFQIEQKQIIQLQTYANRILFINETQFLFQPNNNQNVHIYQYNSEFQSFQTSNHNIKQVQADDDYQYFPSKFLSTKGCFANIHNKYMYITKQLNDEEYEIQQIIEFDDYRKFGSFTEDGEYLVTWHYTSSEFQIRKNVGTSRIQW
ncbi:unnamed protein product (macronuclear) [Paramecium tetraurelia]|uniref:Uncharacterized protein n=1 Tax=Paramecium tetraurelia TaxID=5888 RepID=A0BRT1_PARTE|nr:uncharacterized protein GSPATT00031479001 [Paramecium tetraurelia]CAK61248.1 unnamed protein product [Paramecium tetraurelia]|eukprot:XP_001428646.1 hypothetical protein (macronuclear) [Paramecium tetraurelia strain d4-2]